MIRVLLTVAILPVALAQIAKPPPPVTERYVGVVEKVEYGNRALLVLLDTGGQKWIGVPQTVELLRISAGEKDIARSVRMLFDEVRSGDRIVIRGASPTADTAVAEQVFVMTQADLARQQQAELADWKARGVSGKVTAVRVEAGELTITTAPRPISMVLTVRVTQKTEQRRYRADSARFRDARPAAISDVLVGDLVQALGSRSSDGKILSAEKIVSGLFRNFAATVKAVNPALRELTVQTANGGPSIMLKIGPSCLLRKLRAEAAAALGSRKAGPDPQSVLESSPAVTLAELKTGDAVIIATGANGQQAGVSVPAIAVIAGAEALLKRSSEAQRELLRSWDLSLDPGAPGERGDR